MTISIGGAAKLVSAPPIEILTNNTPIVKYINLTDFVLLKMLSLNKKAANVIAAGSVMSEPNMGTNDSVTK